MRAHDLILCLKEAIKANTAAMIHGSPGIGKSAIVHQVAEELGLDILDYRLSQIDAVDLRGVPSIANGRTRWNPPEEFPKTDTKKPGILFLDEINSAPQSVQAAAYQLVLDRELGTYQLPDNWIPIAAGNRVTDRAIVNQMPTPLRNRFIHFELEPSIDDWAKWAAQHGIAEQVIAFLRFRPDLLDAFTDAKGTAAIKDSNSIPTPRSWATAARFVDFSAGPRLQMMRAAVGDAASEFESYLRVYDDLIDLDELMKDPKKYKEPKNPGAMYAVATGVAARVAEDSKKIPNFFKILQQMPTEFAAMAVKDAEHRNKDVCTSPEFLKWANSNLSAFIR